MVLILLTGSIAIFIRPGNLDQSDFMLIAWEPGQQLLKTGSVDANYPYPLWTVVVMLPLVVWTPKTAMLLMFIVNLLMLAASLTLLMLIFEWQITSILLAMSVSLSSFFLPVLSSLWLGQLTIFSLFILALTVYFYLHERWEWLGVALGLSFIKPQIMLLLAGLLLLKMLLQKRWKVLISFSLTMIVLVAISLPFISTPAQIIGGGIGSHLNEYILSTSTIWGVSLSMGLPWFIPLIISGMLMLWCGWSWLPFLRGQLISSYRAIFIFSIAIMVNLVVIPYSWMHNLIMLLLPIGYGATLVSKMKKREQVGWLLLLFLVMHPLMFLLFIFIVIPRATQAYQIIPVLILLPVFTFLENKTTQEERLRVEPTLSR
jgi:hypothetical protein